MDQLIIDFYSLSLDEKLAIIQESILSEHQADERLMHIQELVLSAKGYESHCYFQD